MKNIIVDNYIKNIYNIASKIDSSQSSLKVSLMTYAKRDTKVKNYLRRKQSNALWWHILNSPILQKNKNKMVFTESSLLSPKTRQSLLFCRSHIINFIYYYFWNRKSSEIQNPPVQWFFSKYCWTKIISKTRYIKEFFKKAYSKNIGIYCSFARFISHQNDFAPISQDQPYFRYRFNNHNCLWQTRRISNWLQSTQTRQGFIPAFCLFRSSYSRLLARMFPFWRRTNGRGAENIYSRMSPENSSGDISHQNTSRLQILYPPCGGNARRETNRICHRSPYKFSVQKDYTRTLVPNIQKEMGSGKVQIQTTPMEKIPSLYSSSPANTRQSRKTINPFYAKQLCISYNSYQFAPETRRGVVLLLWQSKCRIVYQRTKKRLFTWSNTNKIVSIKSNIFSFINICLRYCKLVQTSLFAKRFPKENYTYIKDRLIGAPSKIGKYREQKCIKVTKKLYLSKSISICSA